MQKITAALLAIAAFFASKDTWTAIIGAVLFFSAKYGWGVDAQSCWTIAGLTMTLLAHSAIVNHGAGAAVANQETARLQLEHARLQARMSGMTIDRPETGRHNSSQAGSIGAGLIAAIAVVATVIGVGACAWWSSTGKTKAEAGGKAAAACVLGDVGGYLGDYEQALGSDGYDQAVRDVEKKNNVDAELTKCALKTIVAVLTARPAVAAATPSTSQPTVVVQRAQAYLEKIGASK